MNTNMYKPEGMNGTRELPDFSLAALERARETGKILEATANICTPDMALKVNLGTITGIIPKEEAALTSEGEKVKDIAVITRVGKPVCFKVTGFERSGSSTVALLSRRLAQEECMRSFLMCLESGDVIDAKVTHLEPFGVFCDIGCGIISLLPIDSISVSRISHPRDRFYPGMEIRAVIKSIDYESGRIYLSHKELLGTWEENVARFSVGQTVSGIIHSTKTYGIFVELAPNLAGLAELKDGIKEGESCAVYIKSIMPEKMKIKLVIIDSYEKTAPQRCAEYFIDTDKVFHIDYWRYSPDSCPKIIETDFSEA